MFQTVLYHQLMASGPHTLHFVVDEQRVAVRSGAAAWEPLLVLGDSVRAAHRNQLALESQ